MARYRSRDDYRGLYDALVSAERKNLSITKQTLIERTGYKAGTVGAYIRNKLKNLYLFETKKGNYTVRGVNAISFESFSYYMSQKSHDVEDRDASLTVSLRNRGIQAYYSALAIYNNPTQKYRVESFCVLLANAWELLLKARIVELQGPIAIERGDGKTISLAKSAELVFPDRDSPVRRNIERINELRDKAVHLLIPDIQRSLSRLFQSSVLNFLRCVEDFHYPNPYASQLPGLLSLVSDQDDLSESVIATRYGPQTKDNVSSFLASISEEEENLSSNDFAISINYRIVLTKDAREGDLTLAPSKEGTAVRLVEVPKDHNKTHPYRSKEAIEAINRRLSERGSTQRFNAYSFQGFLAKEKIRTSPENRYHHLIQNPKTSTYSEELVEMAVRKSVDNSDYVENCKRARTIELSQRK